MEERQIRLPKERLLLPWALACAAKEAIRVGTEMRPPGVSLRDLHEICGAYNALIDPLVTRDPTLGGIERFFVRLSYEQFPFQLSPFEEVTRPYAMLSVDEAQGERTEVVDSAFWQGVLHCSIRDFVGVGFLLSVAAQKNQGWFNETWLRQPNFEPIVAELSASAITNTLRKNFAATIDDLRTAANGARSGDPLLRKYDFNPLVAHPFVHLEETAFLAPVTPLVLRRASLGGLYYMGLEHLAGNRKKQDAYTRDIGLLFQSYVGRQLSRIPSAELLPELVDDGGRRSVDWFVVWEDLVLLVEAKASRLTQEARAGGDRLESDVRRTIGDALEQIDRSAAAIKAQEPPYREIPSDRRLAGLVVTMEPYFFINTPLVRNFLPTPNIDTIVGSARELEYFVALSQDRSGNELIVEVLGDAERRTWDFAVALKAAAATPEHPRNPLLDEVWRVLPWAEKAQKQEQMRRE